MNDGANEQLNDIVENRMNLSKSFAKLGNIHNIAHGFLSIRNNVHVTREEIGKGAIFQVKKLCKSKLVAHVLGNVRQTASVAVIFK